MVRIICLLTGYVFGLFQTGYLYGRMNHIDIRNYGSGNSGTTNALRVLGKKAGLIVFLGDFFKMVLACFLVRLVLGSDPNTDLYVLYTGLGVVLGHNFPCYLHFKGGKGIASMAGLLISMDWRVALVCGVVFLITVILTRYVSLGSIFVVILFFYPDGFLRIPGSLSGSTGQPDGILPAGRNSDRYGHLAPPDQHQPSAVGNRKQTLGK